MSEHGMPRSRFDDWKEMVNAWKHPKHKVKVALVGKYVSYMMLISVL